jgi:L-amino acid N-acyltransferase YncA
MSRIYNESVQGGGHSPTLTEASVDNMRHCMRESTRHRWPLWVLTRPGPHGPGDDGASSEEVVGWAYLRAIAWGSSACGTTGDLWIYVAREWHGTGAAMLMARRVHPEIVRHGFDTLTCWILGGNRRSLSMVRACRLKRWGLLPGIVRYGAQAHDLEIWGCRVDDPEWQTYMTRLNERYSRIERLRAQRVAEADGERSLGTMAKADADMGANMGADADADADAESDADADTRGKRNVPACDGRSGEPSTVLGEAPCPPVMASHAVRRRETTT